MLPYTFLICTIGCLPDVHVWGSEQRELPTLKTPKWWLGKKAEIASMEKKKNYNRKNMWKDVKVRFLCKKNKNKKKFR